MNMTPLYSNVPPDVQPSMPARRPSHSPKRREYQPRRPAPGEPVFVMPPLAGIAADESAWLPPVALSCPAAGLHSLAAIAAARASPPDYHMIQRLHPCLETFRDFPAKDKASASAD